MKRILINSVLFIAVFAIVGFFFVRHNSFFPLISRESLSDYSSLPKLRVATPYPFLGNLISTVGGNRVDVIYMRCETSDTDCVGTFKNTIDRDDIKALFVLGLAVDSWATSLDDKIAVVSFFDALNSSTVHSDSQNERVFPKRDSYFWLAPSRVRKMTDYIARTLAQLDALHRELYISNAYDYGVMLDIARRQARDGIAHNNRKPLFVYGDTWGDFLSDIEITPRENIIPASSSNVFFDKVAKQIRAHNGVLLVDTTFPLSDFALRTREHPIATALIDPLGDLFNTDYIDVFRYNVAQIARVVLP